MFSASLTQSHDDQYQPTNKLCLHHWNILWNCLRRKFPISFLWSTERPVARSTIKKQVMNNIWNIVVCQEMLLKTKTVSFKTNILMRRRRWGLKTKRKESSFSTISTSVCYNTLLNDLTRKKLQNKNGEDNLFIEVTNFKPKMKNIFQHFVLMLSVDGLATNVSGW